VQSDRFAQTARITFQSVCFTPEALKAVLEHGLLSSGTVENVLHVLKRHNVYFNFCIHKQTSFLCISASLMSNHAKDRYIKS